MKIEKHVCDIKDCSNESKYVDIKMQVIFSTEQTEGRSVKPYFSSVQIDICEDCKGKIIESCKYIKASGAMGHNEYII